MTILLFVRNFFGKRERRATVTSKGQVTIPKPILDALHLAEGDRIEFLMETDGSIKVIRVTASVTELKGIVPPPERALSLEQMDSLRESLSPVPGHVEE